MCRLLVIFSLWIVQLAWSMDPAREMQLKYRPDDWISYSVTRNMSGIAMGETHIYFGTSGGVLPYNLFRENWDRPFTVSDGLANQHIRAIAYDWKTSSIWCVTDQSVSYYTPGLEEWRNLSFSQLDITHAYDVGAGEKAIWVDANREMVRIDRDTMRPMKKTPGEDALDQVEWSRQSHQYAQVDLLDYFLPSGYFYKPDFNCIQDLQLRTYRVNSKKINPFSRLFVATQGLGAGFGNMNTLRLEFIPHGLYIADVNAMAWDQEGVWLGGFPDDDEEGGITWWDMETGEWRYFQAAYLPDLSSDHIHAIVADSADVWFGTETGLARYSKSKSRWRTFMIQHNLWGERVLSLALDGQYLWIGTENGLNRMDLSTAVIDRESHERMNQNPVYWIEPDGDYVWVGAEWGMYLYRKSKDEWQTVAGYPAIHETRVTAISVWDGQVWVGTDDGVEMYDHATGEWTGFPDMHFETGDVLSIMADHAIVWVGTTGGLVKYVKAENRWHRYTTDDGLLHNRIQRILPDGDYIWLGTPLGITRFYWNASYRID